MKPLPSKLHLITVNPPLAIQTAIAGFKQEMKIQFGTKHALKLPAHITLQRPFWMAEEQASLLRQSLWDFAGLREAFPVKLNGFGCFTPRVIYVHVANPDLLIETQQELQRALPSAVFLKEKERQQRPILPHLTIATRDLKKEIFPLAWEIFKIRAYHAEFMAKTLTWFCHDGKHWHEIAEFPLE